MADQNGIMEMQPEEQLIPPEQIAQIHGWLNAESKQVRLEALNLLKNLVTWPWDRELGINLVVNGGFLPVMVQHLETDVEPQLQFKAAWILTNVASGSRAQTLAVVDSGAVPPLIRLLTSEDLLVIEQALWALRNIACEGVVVVNQYLEQMMMMNNTIKTKLFDLILTGSVNCLRIIPHLFATLLSSGWIPDAALSNEIMDAIDKLLGSFDSEVVEHCMNAVSRLVQRRPETLQIMLNKRLPSKFPTINLNPHPFLHPPAIRATIRATGNIISHSNPEETRLIITRSNTITIKEFLVELEDLMMRNLDHLLQNPFVAFVLGFAPFDANLHKESMFLLSNLLVEEEAPFYLVPMIKAKLIELVITTLKKVNEANETNFRPELEKIQLEALWVLQGFTKHGSRDQIEYLIETNSFQPLCELLKCTTNKELRQMVLAVLCNILSAVKESNSEEGIKKFCDTIENCNGWKIIEVLQNRKEIGIGDSAKELVYEYAKLVKSLMPQSQVPDVEMDPSRLYFHCTRSDML